MRKIIFYLLLFISTVSFGQTTIANKLKITAAIKDNLASRVMVQDSLTGELKWVLKNSLGTVKSVTGTSGVTVALGTSTPVIGLGAITPTSTNGVSATTMAYNDATSSIQTQLNGKQPSGTYATGTGTASGTNTGDNAVNSLYSGLVSNATHTGDATGATALTITPKAVTLAKMDDVATGTVFYRKTAATGTPEVQTLATLKTDLGLTGTNSGDQTTVSGNAGTATTLQTGRTIAITGDLAYTSPTFNGSANVTATGTLATVNANVGSFTNANVTVNGKGLVTAASSGPTPQAALSGTGLVRSTAGAITYDTNAYITTVNGTAITPSSTNGVSAATMAFNDATSSIQTQLNGKQPSGTYATGTGTASGTNTGDNAVNSLYSGLVSNATHTGDATGATALTVKGINGTLLSTLGTGILKNTTTTGVPSIAVAADFPTLNQNTTGTASNITGVYGGTITSGQVTTALTFTPENAANKQNSLTVDGSGVKYSTVDAVNAGLATKQNTITNPVTGTGAGTTNTIPKFTGVNDLGNSAISDTGTTVSITNPSTTNNTLNVRNSSYDSTVASGTSSLGFGFSNHIGAKIEAYKQATNMSGFKFYTENGFNTPLLGLTLANGGTGTFANSVIGNTEVQAGTDTQTGAGLVVNGAASSLRVISMRTAGVRRWGWRMDDTAEAGSNAGSDLRLTSYVDAGTQLSDVLFAKRSTGNIGIGTITPFEKTEIVGGLIPLKLSNSSTAATSTALRIGGYSVNNSEYGAKLVAYHNFALNANSDLAFEVNGNSEKMRLLSNGNFLLGTTVDNGWKFRVNGGAYLDGNIVQSISDSRINGGDTVGRLIVSNSGTTTYLGLYGSAHATTPNTFSLVTNVAERINVNASGVVKISSLASGTSTQMVTADLNGNLGYQAIPSGGTTNLGYTASATNGIVTSSTGTDATIPLADGTNAGLLAPAGFTNLSNAVTTSLVSQTIYGTKTFNDNYSSATTLAAEKYATSGNTVQIQIAPSITNAGGNLLNVTNINANSSLNTANGVVINWGNVSGGTPLTIQNSSVDVFSVSKTGDINGSKLFSIQVTPQPKNATATLAIAEILTGIITATSTTAVTLTLPTGTLTDAGVQSGTLAVNESFEWTVINLGSSSGAVTMAAGTGHTYVGAASVAIGTSATFRTRKTAANTFVTYRI